MILRKFGRLVRTHRTHRGGGLCHQSGAPTESYCNISYRVLWRGDRWNLYSSNRPDDKEKKDVQDRDKVDEPAHEASTSSVKADSSSISEKELENGVRKTSGTRMTSAFIFMCTVVCACILRKGAGVVCNSFMVTHGSETARNMDDGSHVRF